MKTKFILHGGSDSTKKNEDNSDFYKEILKDTGDRVRILLVLFAKDDEERIKNGIKKVTQEFNNVSGNKELMISVADQGNFIEQIKLSDVINFHGGVSLRLLEALKKYKDIEELLRGKIVSGESAGANVFGKYFYSPSANNVFEGLGILPLKIIPHYREEYKNKLNGIGPDLEELFLPEYKFKVFYK